MVLKRSLLVLLILLLPQFHAWGGEPALIAEVQQPAYPGLSELGPRMTTLLEFAESADAKLSRAADLAGLESEREKVAEQFTEARLQVAALGDPETWYVDRLAQVNDRFRQFRKSLQLSQEELTGRQQEVEEIRTRNAAEADFWKGWEVELRKQNVKVPEKSVKQVKKALAKLADTVNKTAALVLGMQEKVGSLQKAVLSELDRFGLALEQVRKATFRKNAPSFLSGDFYEQFVPDLWQQARKGIRSALVLDQAFLEEFSWVLGLMLFCLVLVGGVITRYRERLHATDEWQFVLRHPWAAGCFAVVVVFAPLIQAPPAIFRFVLLAAGVVAATILATPLMENRRQAGVLRLTAVVLLLTTAFRLIALPQPLYRIYVAVLALAAIPLLISQVNSSRRDRGSAGGRFFRFLMRIGCLVLFVSLAGQISGYMNFSFWLLQATFETGMVVLFAHMVMRLGEGGVDFLLSREEVQKKTFFRKYATELGVKLESLLRLVVAVYGLLYLFPVWRIFSSVGEAWEFFSGLSFPLGDLQISLQMVVLAIASFLLALQVSWLLQGLCETQVFYRKAVDRGVRDAIKKLIHYGMVLIGFLIALSSLGMSLQNFVVLLGAFGVGIGFGLQDIVNNFLSGLILLFERPIKVGDFIVVNDEWGTISKIGLRSTVVETINHAEIIVPNSQLIAEKVTNWTLSSRVARLVVPVGVAYGSDVTMVMQILNEISLGHPDTVHDPAPSILFMELGESSLNFEARVFVQDIASRFRVRSEILQQIDARFREAGIEIPFPQRDLHLRSVDEQVLGAMDRTPVEEL